MIFERSPPKVVSSAKSEGLMGAASTSIKTSSSVGIGVSTLTIDSSTFPSLVTFDLISLEYLFTTVSPKFLKHIKSNWVLNCSMSKN